MNLAELTLLIYVANTAGFTNHGPHKCSQGIQLNMPLKVSCFFHLNWMRNWSHHPHQHQPPSSTYQLSIYYCNPLLTLLGYPTSPFGISFGIPEKSLKIPWETRRPSWSAAWERLPPVAQQPSIVLDLLFQRTEVHLLTSHRGFGKPRITPCSTSHRYQKVTTTAITDITIYNRYDITVLYRSIQYYTSKIGGKYRFFSHLLVIADASDALQTSCPPPLVPVSEIPFVHRLPEAAATAPGKNCHCLVLKMMMQHSFQGTVPLGVPQFWTWHLNRFRKLIPLGDCPPHCHHPWQLHHPLAPHHPHLPPPQSGPEKSVPTKRMNHWTTLNHSIFRIRSHPN